MMEAFHNPLIRYVTVLARMQEDAQVLPLAIEWDEKTTYRIEQILEATSVTVPELSTPAGEKLCCQYTVLIAGKQTHLYFEPWIGTGAAYPGRWFVLGKKDKASQAREAEVENIAGLGDTDSQVKTTNE